MWEFITEFGMLKNIYLKTLVKLRKRILETEWSIWHFQRTFESFQTFIPSKCESSRELILQQNVDLLDVRSHHRIWDAQKHLLQNIWWTEEKDSWQLNDKLDSSIKRLTHFKHPFHRNVNLAESWICNKT